MNPASKTALKISSATAVIVIAVAFVIVEFRGMSRSGQTTAKIWFYDESEKQLYAVPQNTLPPDKGIGGPSGDGYHAVVITFPGEQQDAGKRRIAYLETYSSELKDLLEQVASAHAAGHIYAGNIPSRSSDFFQTKTLVKRVDESEWHPATSPEGHAILTEWRKWRGPNGERPIISVP